MPSARLRLGALLVLLGGLVLLSSTAWLGFFFLQSIFTPFATPPAAAVFFVFILLLGGLTVAVLGAGIFLVDFANRSS